MTGVYQVVQGVEILGTPVVGKWIGKRWCIFSQHDVVYGEFAGGIERDTVVGNAIKLEGYIRNVRSGSGTRLRLRIPHDEGAVAVLSATPDSLIRILGITEDNRRIELKRLKNLDSLSCEVLAHRGGARNSDRLGISENSIEMILHAATLGATGIEIDVKRTRDGQLIVFHDDTFSPRTVQGTYLLGAVENFDLEHINSLGRLIHGEHIPTLSEALYTVVEQTGLEWVWLDIKDPRTVEPIVQVQRNAKLRAAELGRDVKILMGMPSQEVLDAYNSLSDTASTEILVELDAETALASPNCRVWAPVWTRNITKADVDRWHNSRPDRLVFSWTVDLRETIIQHVDLVDGILSNYPTLVTGIQQSGQTK